MSQTMITHITTNRHRGTCLAHNVFGVCLFVVTCVMLVCDYWSCETEQGVQMHKNTDLRERRELIPMPFVYLFISVPFAREERMLWANDLAREKRCHHRVLVSQSFDRQIATQRCRFVVNVLQYHVHLFVLLLAQTYTNYTLHLWYMTTTLRYVFLSLKSKIIINA